MISIGNTFSSPVSHVKNNNNNNNNNNNWRKKKTVVKNNELSSKCNWG